jgi:HPt (histidine-containing phosphotransfer) domain-containing protein
VIPLVLLHVIGSVFIVQFVFRNKVSDVEMEVRNLARFNEVSLQRYVDMAKLAVVTSAEELESIDPSLPEARSMGERVLLSKFRNSMVVNSWLIFEPNAFDGRDAEYRGQYPGETSGRYMRSYVRQGTGYVEAPDMDETLLDNMNISYWYLLPKARKIPFLDIAVDYAFSWDYGIGEGDVNSLSLVAPMFRNGEFTGCVGQDILLSGEILGPEMIPGAVSAIFTPNGILRYHEKDSDVGKSLDELGFGDAGTIKEALSRGETVALSGKHSPLLQTTAFAWFQPVRLTDFNELVYIYAAIPEAKVWDAMAPVLKAALISFTISLIIFVFFLALFYRRVSKPVYNLILACNAISRGKFDTKIAWSDSKNEIGFMTRSLYRMVEQFRIHITLRNQTQALLDMYTRLQRALYRCGNMEDVFDELMPLISDLFMVRRATLVLSDGETGRIAAFFEPDKGIQKTEGDKYLYHRQVAGLVFGKKYLSFNANALREQKIGFVGAHVRSLCILPFLVAGELQGYIILEGDDTTGPVVHSDAALLFLSETVSFMLAQREIVDMYTSDSPVDSADNSFTEPVRTEPVQKEELPVIKAARAVEGLDVDRGLFHSGGVEEQYGELLRISAGSFTAKAQTMRSCYTGDLPAFGIEVHGIKGALNAIGAGKLGEQARELEFAAKTGDAAFCTRSYPAFEEKLLAFAAQLAAIAPKREIASKGQGSVPALIAGLEKALEASRMFDASGAAEYITSLLAYSWEDCAGTGKKTEPPPGIGETLEKISGALEYMDYDEAEHDMILLLDYFMPGFAASGE